jgi:hypothetical protein
MPEPTLIYQNRFVGVFAVNEQEPDRFTPFFQGFFARFHDGDYGVLKLEPFNVLTELSLSSYAVVKLVCYPLRVRVNSPDFAADLFCSERGEHGAAAFEAADFYAFPLEERVFGDVVEAPSARMIPPPMNPKILLKEKFMFGGYRFP